MSFVRSGPSAARVSAPRIPRAAPRLLAVALAAGLLAASAPARAQSAAKAPAGDAARAKVSMCIGCHAIPGYKASFPTVYSVPKIAGQTPQYLAAALEAYRKGDRSHPTMRGIAGSLTDQDIADLAAYYGAK